MTTTRPTWLALALALALAAVHARALDGPPAGVSVAGDVVYRIAPVYYDPGRVDTVIACRNLAGQTVSAAVEVFDDDDRPRGGVVRSTIAPGADVLFVTSADTGLERTIPIPGLTALPSGKARVSATSTELSCAATHRIRSADGALKEMPVELVKKVVSGPSARVP